MAGGQLAIAGTVAGVAAGNGGWRQAGRLDVKWRQMAAAIDERPANLIQRAMALAERVAGRWNQTAVARVSVYCLFSGMSA